MAPEQQVLDDPDGIRAAHAAWVEAGCEAVHTCTFGGNPIRLAATGIRASLDHLHHTAVRLARASGARYVLGDVGPTGLRLPPRSMPDAQAIRTACTAAFEAQGRALATTGVDALHVETLLDPEEALLALRALRASAPTLPVIVSLVAVRRGSAFTTPGGDLLAPVLHALAEAGAVAVGVNCLPESAEAPALARHLLRPLDRNTVPVPLVLQPGVAPRREGGRIRYHQEPDCFAADLQAAVALGVRAVGGCCGTGPRHMAALRARLGCRP